MRTWRLLFVSIALVVLAGCGKTEDSVCGTAADCEDGQICSEGVCQAPSENTCSGDPDCPGGYVCIANQCERRDEVDMGSPNNSSMVDMSANNNAEDMNFDNVAPQVVAITPADGTEDVAADISVTVEFSEAMRATTINIQSIVIRDPSNTVVVSDISYDDATFTATLTPQAALRPATPYRVVVTQFVRDEAGNAITEEAEATFFTAFEEPTGIRAVAEKWAPHIYQAIENTQGGGPNADLPTNVDFDNNFKARDNKSKSVLASTSTKAHVYYNVVESKTHYFITYALYYPVRKTQTATFEHDFTGAVFVVDKATDKLVLVDGVKVQEGQDTSLGYKPDDSAVDGVAQTNFDTFPAADLVDTTHYPMFVTAGEHAPCPWTIDGALPACPHNASEFPDGAENGAVLLPGAAAQEFDDAVMNTDTGLLEMTYLLVPLPSSLWVRRTSVGMEELWQQTAVYTPTGTDRPAMTTGGSPILLPNRLVSDDTTTFGKPPFQWLKTSTETNNGQWIVDPAYLLLDRYDFGETWSQEYCYNVFLDVNLRNDTNNPECGTDL